MKRHSQQKAVFCVAGLMVVTLTSQRADAQHHHHYRNGVHHGGAHYAGHYSAHHHHSHGLVYGGYGYYPVYANGYPGTGVIYSTAPAVAQNVAPANAIPVALASDSGPITIINPSDSGGEVSYTLNGTRHSIKPGETQTLQNDRSWTIAFGSGGAAGDVRYALKPAMYRFKVTKVGWNLFKVEEQAAIADYPPAPTPQFDLTEEEPRSVLIPITQP